MQETQSTLIEGKVAKILNARELVINQGSKHGIEAGMRFKVVEESEEIVDPDTLEILGTISREKIRVKVADAQPRFAIARTYQTYEVQEPNAGMFAFKSRRGDRFNTVTKVRTLAIDLGDIRAPYDESKGFVAVGDKVVQID